MTWGEYLTYGELVGKSMILIHKEKQHKTLLNFESKMSLGPVAAAARLDTSYDTYKAWKSGRNKMPGCAYVAIGLWLAMESGPSLEG